jgi:hypothetical protein
MDDAIRSDASVSTPIRPLLDETFVLTFAPLAATVVLVLVVAATFGSAMTPSW